MDKEWDEIIKLQGNWMLLKDSIGNVFLAYNHGDFHTSMYMGMMTIPEGTTLENAVNMLRSAGEITTLTQ